MPTRVKLDVVIRQCGVCKQTGEKLGTLENTRFDHRPALWERQFDTETNDTVPPANDPAFIEALTKAGHDVRTFGPGGEKRVTTLNSDSGRRAKDRRVVKREAAHSEAMAMKTAAEIRSRMSPERQAKIEGRANELMAEAMTMKSERRDDVKKSNWPKGKGWPKRPFPKKAKKVGK